MTAPITPLLPLLIAKNVAISRGQGAQKFTVKLSELILNRGDIVAITGRSGSGKSSLLELFGLLTAPTSTQKVGGFFKWYDEETDIHALWNRNLHSRLARIRGNSMGFVLQTSGLLPFLTVQENLALVPRTLGFTQQTEYKKYLDDLIAQLDIEKLLRKKPQALSVGEQQRASIVRALAHKPRLLIADEPTSALDPGLGDKVMQLLLTQARKHNTAVLIATHEIQRVTGLEFRTFSSKVVASATDTEGATWEFVEQQASKHG